eukprot:gene18754-18624_t
MDDDALPDDFRDEGSEEIAIEPAEGEVLATGAVLESVDELKKARTVRLPVHMVRELNQILRGKYHLEARQHDGKDATAEDIAELVGRPVEEVQDILA